MIYSVLEYVYCDASNYKSYGEVWLEGDTSPEFVAKIIDNFDSAEFFIAEQIGIPPLYHKLFRHSDGQTCDDHAWHTFKGVRSELKLPEGILPWGTVEKMTDVISEVKGNWKPDLSPNFTIGLLFS